MTFRLKATLAAVASALALLALPKLSLAAQILEEIPGIAGLRWSTGVQMLLGRSHYRSRACQIVVRRGREKIPSYH
jgi:hypothetical protein